MEPITSTSPLDSTSTAQTKPTTASDQQNQFLKLLVAQLKGQDPLNPMDSTAFVGQLAQFSSLEELTKIHGTLDSVQQLLSQQQANTPQTTTPQTNSVN